MMFGDKVLSIVRVYVSDYMTIARDIINERLGFTGTQLVLQAVNVNNKFNSTVVILSY